MTIHSKVTAGIVGGLIAGVVFGMMMTIMTAPTPEGGQIPMMLLVAKVVRSDSLVIGWLYHLFNSAVIGAIFGALFGERIRSYGVGLGWGAVYGFAWWILGGLILMPVLIGLPVFAPVLVPAMQIVGLGSLMGHLIYGVILGVAFAWLHKPAVQQPSRMAQTSGATRPLK